MNIIIIFHSKTGTTRKFAERIANKLQEDGHSTNLIQIETDVPIESGSVRRCAKFSITNLPDITNYDTILLGGPVWAFSASPVIIECIKGLKDFQGKRVIPFVTQGFPFKFLGGKQAIALMSKYAVEKKAKTLPGFIVSKLFHNIEKEMDKAAVAILATLNTHNCKIRISNLLK